MLNEQELSAAIGTHAYGPDGDKIGTVEYFFLDDRTGAPSWVAISTSLLGGRRSIAPATEAAFSDGALRLPVSKGAVRSAPDLPGEHLDPAEEELLRRHYDTYARPGDDSSARSGDDDTHTRSGDNTAPRTDPDAAPPSDQDPTRSPAPDGSMTRSEERLRVGTERVAATRMRLVKYVVTEEVQVTVPLRREEIRVEEVPMDAPDAEPGESLAPAGSAASGDTASGDGAPSGLPDEIVLHAERPVVTVEVVPVERVRLRTEEVHGQEQVRDRVQRERIAVDEDRWPREERRPS